MLGEVVEGLVQVRGERTEAPEQDVGHAAVLQVFPEPLDEVEVRTVVRQPEDLNMLFDILEVAVKGLGVMRLALVQNQHDPSTRLSRPANQFL